MTFIEDQQDRARFAQSGDQLASVVVQLGEQRDRRCIGWFILGVLIGIPFNVAVGVEDGERLIGQRRTPLRQLAISARLDPQRPGLTLPLGLDRRVGAEHHGASHTGCMAHRLQAQACLARARRQHHPRTPMSDLPGPQQCVQRQLLVAPEQRCIESRRRHVAQSRRPMSAWVSA